VQVAPDEHTDRLLAYRPARCHNSTVQHSVRRAPRRTSLAQIAASLAALAIACASGSSSELAFLADCRDECGAGLSCLRGICTRACPTTKSDCSDLAARATCADPLANPGDEPVCDVSCTSGADCSELGDGYACAYGSCRHVAGSQPGRDCFPVGRYEVGKEGGYLPCCPGLTQLSTWLEATSGGGDRVCTTFPVNSYACIEGSCGDGICEAPEAPCACGVDCPDSNWRASDDECHGYRDAPPPLALPALTIVNGGAVPLYILPQFVDCTTPPSLIRVLLDGQPLNVVGGGDCDVSCERVLEEGGPYAGPGATTPACPSIACSTPSVVRIEPGQSIEQAVGLEVVHQQLPRACAERISTETTPCISRVLPEAGRSYVIEVRALSDASPCQAGGCFCTSDGACPGAGTPLLFTLPTASYFENQVLNVAAPNGQSTQ
jgi:hypothetical protein